MAWAGIEHSTDWINSRRPLFGRVEALQVGSRPLTNSTNPLNWAAVCLRMVSGSPRYLHGKLPNEQPKRSRTRFASSSVHHMGIAALFCKLTRRPEASPNAARILEHALSCSSFGLMNIMMSSTNIDSRCFMPTLASGARTSRLEASSNIRCIGSMIRMKSTGESGRLALIPDS